MWLLLLLSSATSAVFLAVLVALLVLLFCWLSRPLNRVRRLGDVGFYFGEPQLSGRYRDAQLERAKRLRLRGDLPPVYPNGWFAIAESPELRPKQIKPVVVFGQQLTLFRAENGSVHLIDSYCPHLGANFNVGGKVVDDNCVRCPFHGWVFSGESGRCTRIPYSTASIPEQAKVSVWPVVERNRHIYVWYDSDGNPPAWEIPEIDEIASGEWTYKGRTEHEVMCHVQEIPENGADLAHLGYLHLTGSPLGNDVIGIDLNNSKPMLSHFWDGSWTPSNEQDEKHLSTMHLEQVLRLCCRDIPLTASKLDAVQVGPGIVHMHFSFGFWGRGVVLHHVTPEEPLFQRARFVMYSELSRWFSRFFLLNEAAQFERDIFVWSNKRYVKSPLLVRDDGPIAKHRRWFAQFYSPSSPRVLPDGSLSTQPKSTLDW